mgnify:FL=1
MEHQRKEGEEEASESYIKLQGAKAPEDVTFQLVSDIHLEFDCVDMLPKIPVNSPILCLLGISDTLIQCSRSD